MKKSILIVLIAFILLSSCSFNPPLIPLFSGDCVDRATEIRDHLKSQGYICEIVLGRTMVNYEVVLHAWIRYKEPGQTEWIRYYHDLTFGGSNNVTTDDNNDVHISSNLIVDGTITTTDAISRACTRANRL
jgi:hypothetical protein